MSEGQKFQLGTVGALSLSVVSSVSIVICNKALISTLGFTFATTLTSWHLLVTFCSLHMALWMKLFEHKPFDARAVMGFGILNGISIGLLNLSLGFNSVGFYQMTKLAIIPCTVLLETLFFRKQFSRSIQLSLTILLMGVGIATVTDLQLNVLGSILSLLAVLTTCVAQIMTNTIQKKFRVSSTQLLYQSCPYQALTLFIVGPFLDGLLTNKNVFAFKYTPLVLFFIVLSCLISVSVNFSTFLVIGKTSPVTYQVLGHLKTCLVLAFGYGLLRDHSAGATFWESSLQWLEWYCILTVAPLRISRSKMKHQQNCLRSRKVKTDPLISAENGAGILADGGVPKIKKSGNKTVSAMKMLLARVYHIAGVVQTAKFLLFVLWLYSYSSVKKNKYIPCPPKLPGSQLF
ncbi:UDP-xylose transporter 3 [Populus alba x Populus x berolinensis]|uniref:UDP-xylose transporter 3 n=2 Tax=Populus alba x Populus x berolinensis TaxID=444605 RepID=A0AAD6L9S2_9ROSI|nr:UDP-xylose transporter 3 [Populus alba x Populus x berolinensis]